ncbi:MAG: hypothetical protein AMJ84_05440 [Acidithiobacillales bacterium SM23_46]|nr:MAG: hypothetical protein AMJ84_05440 [Acidithiobacillales bacterium SM23_46]KPL27973.1 MAG: hypothetical protein AMJ72_05915 [Acidithiobacillales bacterium SM1_46]
MERIRELLEKRATRINQAREVYNGAENEKRDPTAEERQQFDKLMNEAATIKQDVDNLRNLATLEAAEKELAESQGRQTESERANKAGEQTNESQVIELRSNVCGDSRVIIPQGETASKEYRQAFRRYLLTGRQTRALQAHDDAELRALQADDDVGGGYVVVPQQFMAELIQGLDDDVFMRRISRVLPPLLRADSLGVPTLDADPSDPIWTPELATGDEDSSMAFGKREFKPQPLAKRAKISKTLLRKAAMPVESLVKDRLRYKFGVAEDNNFLNGDGDKKPLGVFTANDDGIGTARDVSTGNQQTELRFDGLKNAKYALKAGYRRRAQWIFHRDAIKQLSTLKDGEGRYIWVASTQRDQADLLLNLPFNESEYAPNTFTAAKYVGIVGDFSYYWIVDGLEMIIQVLTELYAETNQNGYFARKETDGMPVLAAAFARVKLAP